MNSSITINQSFGCSGRISHHNRRTDSSIPDSTCDPSATYNGRSNHRATAELIYNLTGYLWNAATRRGLKIPYSLVSLPLSADLANAMPSSLGALCSDLHLSFQSHFPKAFFISPAVSFFFLNPIHFSVSVKNQCFVSLLDLYALTTPKYPATERSGRLTFLQSFILSSYLPPLPAHTLVPVGERWEHAHASYPSLKYRNTHHSRPCGLTWIICSNMIHASAYTQKTDLSHMGRHKRIRVRSSFAAAV